MCELESEIVKCSQAAFFVTSNFYGKVPRPFFPPPQRKTGKSGLAM